MYIYSNTTAKLLYVLTQEPLADYQILDAEGKEVPCAIMRSEACEDGFKATLDASALRLWSMEDPALYTFCQGEEKTKFGFCSMQAVQNKMILFNDSPIYLRGYIRGIRAHEHPNMTGKSNYEAALKNIRQAKKYGFNLVRFHSTIPSEDFVRAADELGMLIHMEIGFAYDYDEHGNKKRLSMNNQAWVDTLLKYRNNPSMAIFCIGNEMHNSGHYPQVRKLYEQGRALAPGKLFMDNSGWGEYDRDSADIFCQHIAYFFPFKHHKYMFKENNHWHFNGSSFDVPLKTQGETSAAAAKIDREPIAIRPTLAHEAMHYIDVPDYEAMNAKYEAFAKEVGPEYLEKHGIEKPRFLTELPELIRRKGLTDRLKDYQVGSREWKLMAMKVYLEEMRLSPLCGYEMLQFADCLKYENKNGIVDCFDDDKGIDPLWLRQMNDDLVLLADLETETAYEDEKVGISLYASDFMVKPEIRGDYKLWLDGELLYEGKDFILAGGLQLLAKIELNVKPTGKARMCVLKAEFAGGDVKVTNSWKLWFYPRKRPVSAPELQLQEGALKQYLAQGTEKSDLVVTDSLTENTFAQLEAGKTVVLFYEYKAERNTWQFPGALERFKPCIWDRGSNLGGIIFSEKLQKALGSGRYFDLHMQPLLEAGSKINLDDFPGAVTEFVSGIDKPVRDRMRGLMQGIKHFIDEDTLRKFTHLFSVNVGAGKLIVCTMNVSQPENPVVANLLCQLIDNPELFASDCAMEPSVLRKFLEDTMAKGLRPEDVMNHFWEIDNKIVEDTLYWEEVGVNFAKKKKKSDE